MNAQELIDILVEGGLDQETAKRTVAHEKVAAKTGSLKQQSEYDAILAKTQKLEDEGKAAKKYVDWYSENFDRIKAIEATAQKYQEKYGSLDAPTPGGTGTSAATFTEKQVREIVASAIGESYQKEYGPRVVGLFKAGNKITEKHIRAGFKKEIDWDEIDKIAGETGGDINAAYERWIKPDMEIRTKEADDKRIEARVKEELAKRGSQRNFPGGDSSSNSGPFSKRAAAPPKDGKAATYDRNAVLESIRTGKLDPHAETLQ